MPGNVLGTRLRCVQSCDKYNGRAGKAYSIQSDIHSLRITTESPTRRQSLF